MNTAGSKNHTGFGDTTAPAPTRAERTQINRQFAKNAALVVTPTARWNRAYKVQKKWRGSRKMYAVWSFFSQTRLGIEGAVDLMCASFRMASFLYLDEREVGIEDGRRPRARLSAQYRKVEKATDKLLDALQGTSLAFRWSQGIEPLRAEAMAYKKAARRGFHPMPTQDGPNVLRNTFIKTFMAECWACGVVPGKAFFEAVAVITELSGFDDGQFTSSDAKDLFRKIKPQLEFSKNLGTLPAPLRV